MDASNGWWTDHFVVHPASTSSAHIYYHNNNSNNPQGKTARGQGKQATPLQPTWKAGLSAASSYSTHPRPHRSGGERSRIRRGEEQRLSGKESGVCWTAGELTNHDFCVHLLDQDCFTFTQSVIEVLGTIESRWMFYIRSKIASSYSILSSYLSTAPLFCAAKAEDVPAWPQGCHVSLVQQAVSKASYMPVYPVHPSTILHLRKCHSTHNSQSVL